MFIIIVPIFLSQSFYGSELSGHGHDVPQIWFRISTTGNELEKRSYMISNEYRNALAAVKWGADYFIKCHTAEFEFYGQVYQTKDLNDFWGRPEDLDEKIDTISFKCNHKKPCSDLLAETAAALAATGLVFKGGSTSKIFENSRCRNLLFANFQILHIQKRKSQRK